MRDIHLSDKAAQLYTENRSLAEKVLEALEKILKAVKDAYEGLKLQSYEGQFISKSDVETLEQAHDLFIKGVRNASLNMQNRKSTATEDGARLQARKSTQGKYSSKSIDDYTRTQYNSYGWVVINNVLTVNELNRFYKQFADKKALRFNYKKSSDGYYMIPTGDKSMVDSKVIFVSGTLQNPYIDRVIEVTGIEDDEKTYYINEVIDNEEYDSSYDDLEAYAGKGVFRTYTQTDFASYSELKKRYNRTSEKNTSKQDTREGIAKKDNDTVKFSQRDSEYLSAVERGDTETA